MTDTSSVRGPHGVAIALFLLVWLSCVWFGSNPYNPNNITRMFAAISLVEDHDATIDQFELLTVDKAKIDGRYYMDKTPGITLMGLPAVHAANAISGERSSKYPWSTFDSRFLNFLRLRMLLMIASGAAILLAFASVLLLDMATGITGSPRAGLVAALTYALGTPAWGWSTTLFGHAPAGALLIVAAWAVWRGTSGPRELARWRYPLMLGLSLGWAVVIELPVALPGLVIGLWAVWRTAALPARDRLRLVAITIVAGLVALVPMGVYNQIAFGTPFKIGYQGVVGFEGMNQGLFGLTYPHIEVLAQIIAGPDRGLIFVAPILALAPWGLWRLRRDPATRDIGIVAIVLVAVVLLYNASYFYWDGGHSTGPRHSIPAMGFLALGLAPLWRAWGVTGRRWIVGLLALSMVINLAIAAAEITTPHGFHFPVYDPVMTRFVRLDIRTLPSDWWGWPTWRGLALYLVLALPALWFILRATRLSENALQDKPAAVA